MIINLFKLTCEIVKLRCGVSRPIVANLFLTNKCNLSCITCDMWQRYPFDEIKKVELDYFFKNSTLLKKLLFINIEGGEIFALDEPYEYIFIILQYAKPLAVRFTTNGYNTEQIVVSTKKILKYTKLNLGFRISLDGLRQTHDYIRGREGAFDNALRTIENLVKLRKTFNNLSINIGFTVNALNYIEIEDIYKLANRLRVGFTIKPVQATKILLTQGNLKNNLLLRDDMNNYIIEQLKNIRIGYMPFSERLVHHLSHTQFLRYLRFRKRTIKCYAGNATLSLLPTGDISICFINNYIIGNLYRHNLDEIWRSKRAEEVRKQIRKSSCCCICNTETIGSLIVEKFPFYF